MAEEGEKGNEGMIKQIFGPVKRMQATSQQKRWPAAVAIFQNIHTLGIGIQTLKEMLFVLLQDTSAPIFPLPLLLEDPDPESDAPGPQSPGPMAIVFGSTSGYKVQEASKAVRTGAVGLEGSYFKVDPIGLKLLKGNHTRVRQVGLFACVGKQID